jgi:dihydroorotate dehydrogenase (fumarate)
MSTTYMGLELAGPLVPSAGPLSHDLDNLRRMADAGASAVVLWSLFEEQLRHEARELEHYLQYGAERFAESLSYFPEQEDYKLGPDEYLEHVSRAVEAVDIPVIASLNGVSVEGFTSYAEQIQQAGAAALELNVYYIPTDPALDGETVESVYLRILQAVREKVSIPVAMKLSPYFSSPSNFMHKLDDAGADALVLFNRFYQPDIDPEALEVVPSLVLSESDDNRLPQRWIAILFDKLQCSLAATSGVHTGLDAAKLIMAGADVVMMCSALLRNGIDHIKTVQQGLEAVMHRHDYESVQQMKGVLSQAKCAEPAAFERANYMKALNSFGPTATME